MRNYITDKSRQAYFEKRLDKEMLKLLVSDIEDLFTRNKGFKYLCRALSNEYSLEMLNFEGNQIHIKIVDEFGEDKEGMRFISFIIVIDFETEEAEIEQALFSSTYEDDDNDDMLEYPICAFNPYTFEMMEWLYTGEGYEIPNERFL